MSWIEDLLEKMTHRGELAGLLDSLHARLADLEEKRHEYALRCETAEKALQALSGRIEKMEAILNERIGVVEADRTELFARLDKTLGQLDELRERLAETEARQEDDSRVVTLETDRTELFARQDKTLGQLDELRERLAETESRQEDDSRVAALETDRTELFTRLDESWKQLEELRERFAETEAHRENDSRVAALETDRTELFARLDESWKQLEELRERLTEAESRQADDSRLTTLETDRTELFTRVDELKERLRRCGILNLNARFDSRITRLEILDYYADKKHYTQLNERQKALLDSLKNDYDYERSGGRTYPEDPLYEQGEDAGLPYPMGQEDGLWYALVEGKKVFFGENRHDAEAYLKETVHWLEGDTPHRYLYPPEDGVDVPEGAILLDIGAAEGYFGMRYLDRCKKVYFFECDEKWLEYLRRTCAPYMDKIEIVNGFVGDRDGQIRLDEFFKDREKPTVVKMDVEGAEGAVLRGMSGMLHDPSLPMTLLICTYHRQEDWDRYEAMLRDEFELHSSEKYYWDMQDPYPPFFRKGIMRAVKIKGKPSKQERENGHCA